jgi:hypothetical protein
VCRQGSFYFLPFSCYSLTVPQNFSHKTSYVLYGLLVVSSGLLFYVWNTTNPATVAPVGILGVFILLYFFWLSVFFIIIHLGFLLLQKTNLLQLLINRRKGRSFKPRIAYYIASIVAFFPVLILAIQSINQLTIRDILLVIAFVCLAVFYVIKRL